MVMLLKGKEAADAVYGEIGVRMEALRHKGVRPQLAVVLVEGDSASAYYAEAKRKIAERLGVLFHLHRLGADAAETEVLALVRGLNRDSAVHGILLELPLPSHLKASAIEAAIAPEKDIDGVAPANRLAVMAGGFGLYPATPQACIRLLRHYGYELAGKNVTLVGRGQTVGMPLFHMLQREQATVTVCHSRTADLAAHLRGADFAVVAAGRASLVTEEMVHPGLVVVDAGINETAEGGIVGDVAAGVRERAAAVSPVPGGVGGLTTAILFRNLMEAAENLSAVREAGGAVTARGGAYAQPAGATAAVRDASAAGGAAVPREAEGVPCDASAAGGAAVPREAEGVPRDASEAGGAAVPRVAEGVPRDASEAGGAAVPRVAGAVTEPRDASAAGDANAADEGRESGAGIWDGSIRSFLERAGSADPTPGGGSIAAIGAALGAAMTAMVGNLTRGDRFEEAVRTQMAQAAERMAALSARYESLLEEDMASFGRYMAALRQPKDTDEQKRLRKEALQEAAAASIDVPLRLMELCLEGVRCAADMAADANRNVISDLGIGAVQFEAAARSALLTVEMNLASLRGTEEKQVYADAAAGLMEQTETLCRLVLGVVRARMAE